MHARISDPGRLAVVMPCVARYSGTMGPTMLDAGGDLAADTLEVWRVRDGGWILAGVMG